MNKYDIIFDSIQNKYNNNEITYEFANELNNLAYNKYIINESVESKIDKNHKQKGNKDLNSFKKVEINRASLNNYKNKEKYLSHIRETCKGYIYLDKLNNVVAVIAVENKRDGKWIQALEVSEKYKGYNLSTQLLKVAEDLGARFLSVNKKNEIAISLYKKNGYKVFKQDENMFYMKK